MEAWVLEGSCGEVLLPAARWLGSRGVMSLITHCRSHIAALPFLPNPLMVSREWILNAKEPPKIKGTPEPTAGPAAATPATGASAAPAAAAAAPADVAAAGGASSDAIGSVVGKAAQTMELDGAPAT